MAARLDQDRGRKHSWQHITLASPSLYSPFLFLIFISALLYNNPPMPRTTCARAYDVQDIRTCGGDLWGVTVFPPGSDERELRGGHGMGLGRALSRSVAPGDGAAGGQPGLLAPNEWALNLRRLSQETRWSLTQVRRLSSPPAGGAVLACVRRCSALASGAACCVLCAWRLASALDQRRTRCLGI